MDILHQDDDLAVLNKPADVSLLADRSGAACLWDSLPEVLGRRPFLVHRLDKPTSGVLAIALNVATQKRLTKAFFERRVAKYYLAWVLGDPGSHGTIDLPLKKGRKSRYRVAGQRADIQHRSTRWTLPPSYTEPGVEPDADGHPSLTRFRSLARTRDRTLLLLMPKTGRTHQLRVHLSWIGHPILGDRLYGNPKDPAQGAERLYLHAHRLVLPETGSWSAAPGPEWG